MTICRYCGKEFARGIAMHEKYCKDKSSEDVIAEEEVENPIFVPQMDKEGNEEWVKADAATIANLPELFPVKLLKNYKPMQCYRIVSDPPPEMTPYPGVGQKGKLWEGTVVELPKDEVRRLFQNQASFVVSQKDPQGKTIKQTVKRAFPLAERADDLPL